MGKGRKCGSDRLLYPANRMTVVSDRLPDFEEADIWATAVAVAQDATDRNYSSPGEFRSVGARRPVGGLSLALEAPPPAGRRHAAAGSAPVSVPEWAGRAEPDRDDGEWLPPHEHVARSRGGVATSVCEGAGRTLKGRDMSRVRDAVWSQTGFFG